VACLLPPEAYGQRVEAPIERQIVLLLGIVAELVVLQIGGGEPEGISQKGAGCGAGFGVQQVMPALLDKTQGTLLPCG